jgi:hypothetical protein
MSDPGVVVATRTEVHDVLHADFPRDIQKVFALSHHVDGIARDQKRTVDALQGRRDGFRLVKIEAHHWNPKRSCFLRIASGRYHFDFIVGFQVGKNGLSDLAGRSEDEDLGFVGHE